MNAKPIIRIGQVVSINDEYDGDRIKVRIYPHDNQTADKDLPYAFPLLPKMLHIKPKIGEAVIVFNTEHDITSSQRYYIGPLIHQPQSMDFDPFQMGATTLLKNSINTPHPAISRNPEAYGSMPKKEEIGILGRRDTDILMGDKDVKIRCGVKTTNNNDRSDIKFNRTNPSYIKLKYHDAALEDKSNSTISLVSQNINLLTTEGQFDLADKDELITDDVMNEILASAHVLPYGDELVRFLKLFLNAFMNHVHPYSGMPPIPDINVLEAANFNLDEILSKNIRIN